MLEEEGGDLAGRLSPLRPARGRRGLGERGAHHGVPLGDDLVVETRPDTPGAGVAELGPGGLDLIGPHELAPPRPVQDVAAFEVPPRADAVPLGRGPGRLLAEHGGELFGRPEVIAALFALRVGVLGGVKAPARVAQLAQHIAERLAEHLQKARVAVDLPGVQVDAGDEGLVVEHLLEMGHGPVLVDRVARETTPEMVVDASRRHRLQGELHHLERSRRARADVVSHQQVQQQWLGEPNPPSSGSKIEPRRSAAVRLKPASPLAPGGPSRD